MTSTVLLGDASTQIGRNFVLDDVTLTPDQGAVPAAMPLDVPVRDAPFIIATCPIPSLLPA